MSTEPRILQELKEKKRLRLQRVSRRLVIGAGAVLALAFVSILLGRSTFLEVKGVTVSKIDNSELRYVQRIDIQIPVEKAAKGKNIFGVDTTLTEQEIYSVSPFIKSCIVEKVFPNELKIVVEEREPYILVDTLKNCYLLDDIGYVLQRTGVDQTDNTDEDSVSCESMKADFQVIQVQSKDIKADFPLGYKSTFYEVEKLKLLSRVLRDRGYELSKVEIVNEVLILEVGEDKVLVFSNTQEFDLQLKRFILVASKIKEDNISFRSLDLRYKRPVLRKS